MPRVQMPDGAIVDMPDTPSPDQITRLRSIQSKPKSESGVLDKAVGAGEAGLSMATGFAGSLAGNVAGAARTLTGGKYGTPEGIEQGIQTGNKVSDALTYQPRTQAGQDMLHGAGQLLDDTKVAGLNPAIANEIPIGTMRAMRAKAAPAMQRVGAAAEETAAADRAPAAVKMSDPEKSALARKALDYGIDLRPDMLSDNKFMRMIGEAFDKIPLAGSKAEQRQVAFNRGLLNLIGGDADAKRITPAVFDRAITKSGQKIGGISEKAPVNVDSTALERNIHETAAFATEDVAKVVKSYVDEINAKAQGGTIDGRAFREINTKLGKQIRRSEGDMQFHLDALQESLEDMLAGSRTGEELQELQAARKQYAIAKTLEPMVAKSKYGDMSPGGLMNAVTSTKDKKSMMARGRGGELGDLARIGQAFLKEPDTSNTAERAITYGLIGGAAVEPTTAASIYGAANLYNRLGPRIARRMVPIKDMPPDARDVPLGAGNE